MMLSSYIMFNIRFVVSFLLFYNIILCDFILFTAEHLLCFFFIFCLIIIQKNTKILYNVQNIQYKAFFACNFYVIVI